MKVEHTLPLPSPLRYKLLCQGTVDNSYSEQGDLDLTWNCKVSKIAIYSSALLVQFISAIQGF